MICYRNTGKCSQRWLRQAGNHASLWGQRVHKQRVELSMIVGPVEASLQWKQCEFTVGRPQFPLISSRTFKLSTESKECACHMHVLKHVSGVVLSRVLAVLASSLVPYAEMFLCVEMLKGEPFSADFHETGGSLYPFYTYPLEDEAGSTSAIWSSLLC